MKFALHSKLKKYLREKKKNKIAKINLQPSARKREKLTRASERVDKCDFQVVTESESDFAMECLLFARLVLTIVRLIT